MNVSLSNLFEQNCYINNNIQSILSHTYSQSSKMIHSITQVSKQKGSSLKFDTSFVTCFFNKESEPPIVEVDSRTSSNMDSPEKTNLAQSTQEEDRLIQQTLNKLYLNDEEEDIQNYKKTPKKQSKIQIDNNQRYWINSSQQQNRQVKGQSRSTLFFTENSTIIDSDNQTTHSGQGLENLNTSLTLNNSRNSVGNMDQQYIYQMAQNSLYYRNHYQGFNTNSQAFFYEEQMKTNLNEQIGFQNSYQNEQQTQTQPYNQYNYNYYSSSSSSQPYQQFQFQSMQKKGKRRFEPQKEGNQYMIDLKKIEFDKRTTLMIKNIPNKYTQQLLLQKIDREYLNAYDFFYLPIDFTVNLFNKCNVGYAFINFTDTKFIPSFFYRFHNQKWDLFNSEKVFLHIQINIYLKRFVKQPTREFKGDKNQFNILNIPVS